MFKLREVQDVFCDACVRNGVGEVMFLSLFGRDTVILQFFSALSLKENEGGLSSFRLIDADDEDSKSHLVHVGSADRLEKLTGRLPENLFGNLVHCWVYDPALLRPDKTNKTGWVLINQASTGHSQMRPQVWRLFQQLSPVPLLNHWMDDVLDETSQSVDWMDQSGYPPLGSVSAAYLTLPDNFSALISGMVKEERIGLEAENGFVQGRLI